MKKTVFLLFTFYFLLLNAPLAYADGGFFPPENYSVTQASQKAVIVHQNGVEDLILSVEFYGDAKDFGWLIPVPSKPEVSQGKDELFDKLAQLSKPKKNLLEKIKGEPYIRPLYELGLGGAPEAEKEVEVIERKKVGILDVVVLSAENPKALKEWLDENGYQLPKSDEVVILEENQREQIAQIWPSPQPNINRALQILQEYIDDDWFFVAAKINAEFIQQVYPEQSEGPTPTPEEPIPLETEQSEPLQRIPPYYPYGYPQAHITPLHLKFSTDSLIYPLKITSLGEGSPSILLYVISEHKKCVSNYPISEVNYPEIEGTDYFQIQYASKIQASEFSEWLPSLSDGFLTKLYAAAIPSDLMKYDVRFENTKDNLSVNSGEMRTRDWLLLPIYAVIYGPVRILEILTSGRFSNIVGEFGSGVLLLAGLSMLGFLGIFGFVWCVILYLFLSKTTQKSLRVILRLLQLPGVWLLANFFSIVFLLPYWIFMKVLKVDSSVIAFNLFLTANFGVVFFTALFYKIQDNIHRWLPGGTEKQRN